MRALDVNEIHGYRPDLGLRVFTEEALSPPDAGQAASRKPPNKNNPTRGGGTVDDARRKKLRNISEIRRYFHRNERPDLFRLRDEFQPARSR